ncbi:hypothetical protein L228DRAFT_4 [Xylona heveae TC161]|uniref:Uncharacterized protein n=1 Tax=Xylona heveae (strain CBS 132557 / TC161) TaxID=1328760 RepID=A0A165J7J3_XYLHT|nr:hypothetical protein L228DRAFT_4 [Xylona heveae TC161]KZF25850.1 hypothetical protein L228DRAFT_4 [Xylona heveae TC161]
MNSLIYSSWFITLFSLISIVLLHNIKPWFDFLYFKTYISRLCALQLTIIRNRKRETNYLEPRKMYILV